MQKIYAKSGVKGTYDMSVTEMHEQVRSYNGVSLMNKETAAQKIWDYMLMHHVLKKADVIFVLGNRDTRVAECAAQLYFGWMGTNIALVPDLVRSIITNLVANSLLIPQKQKSLRISQSEWVCRKRQSS